MGHQCGASPKEVCFVSMVSIEDMFSFCTIVCALSFGGEFIGTPLFVFVWSSM